MRTKLSSRAVHIDEPYQQSPNVRQIYNLHETRATEQAPLEDISHTTPIELPTVPRMAPLLMFRQSQTLHFAESLSSSRPDLSLNELNSPRSGHLADNDDDGDAMMLSPLQRKQSIDLQMTMQQSKRSQLLDAIDANYLLSVTTSPEFSRRVSQQHTEDIQLPSVEQLLQIQAEQDQTFNVPARQASSATDFMQQLADTVSLAVDLSRMTNEFMARQESKQQHQQTPPSDWAAAKGRELVSLRIPLTHTIPQQWHQLRQGPWYEQSEPQTLSADKRTRNNDAARRYRTRKRFVQQVESQIITQLDEVMQAVQQRVWHMQQLHQQLTAQQSALDQQQLYEVQQNI